MHVVFITEHAGAHRWRSDSLEKSTLHSAICDCL